MAELKFNGSITNICEQRSGIDKNGNNYSTIDFVVMEKDGQYPNSLVFNIYGGGEHFDKVEKFLKYNKVGDDVEVEYKASVKEYNGKIYNSISAWKVNNLSYKKQAHEEIKSSSATGKVLDKQFEKKIEEPTQIDDSLDLPF